MKVKCVTYHPLNLLLQLFVLSGVSVIQPVIPRGIHGQASVEGGKLDYNKHLKGDQFRVARFSKCVSDKKKIQRK